MLDENGTCIANVVSVFQCHQESAQINIFSILLNIIFKHNLKKLLNSVELLFVQRQGYKNNCKVVKVVRKLFVLFSALW